eukprot:scaffold62339_cov27-Prasinocladus_malaysianus.AAC.1
MSQGPGYNDSFAQCRSWCLPPGSWPCVSWPEPATLKLAMKLHDSPLAQILALLLWLHALPPPARVTPSLNEHIHDHFDTIVDAR